MGYTEDRAQGTIELTYNWDQDKYVHGTGYGHMALEVRDIYAACERLDQAGVNIVLNPGPMNYGPDETGHREVIAFIEDPDGYKIELVEAKTA